MSQIKRWAVSPLNLHTFIPGFPVVEQELAVCLASDVELLEAELYAAQDQVTGLQELMAGQQKTIDACEEEIRRKEGRRLWELCLQTGAPIGGVLKWLKLQLLDAQRYRWFRENSLQIVHASKVSWVHRLDEAIDTAMAEHIARHAEEIDPIQKLLDDNPLSENEAAQKLIARPKRWSKPEGTVRVDRKALTAVLSALTSGAPHLIREMQVTRRLPGDVNPIDQLIDDLAKAE